MKIDRIETFLVAPRWLFCRIETDDGVVGWGEPVVEGRAEVVRAAVDVLAEYLIGADATRIEHLWQVLTKGGFYRGGPVLSSAVAGIDQCLWDIAGKALGCPTHRLLGGLVREAVRVYGWIGGDTPSEVADQAAAVVASGLTAVKMNASGPLPPIPSPAETAAVVRRVESVRAAVGDSIDIAVDFHGRATLSAARRLLAALEGCHLLFAEEPVLPEHTSLLERLTTTTTVPIAVGERLYSRSDFAPAIEAGVAVVQPDLSHAGGISEVRRIAALADTVNVTIAPHCPLGPLALAASLQVDVSIPNFLIQEFALDIHYNSGAIALDYVIDRAPFAIADGTMAAPGGPGLGVEIDETAMRAADRRGHRWRNPVWTHRDGGFAEW